MAPSSGSEKIMVLGDGPGGLAAFVVSLLQRAQPSPRVVVLSKDPGLIVSTLLTRDGHQLQVCQHREAMEVSLSIDPDIVVVEPDVFRSVIREFALSQERLRSLSGLMAICSHCKKIRKPDGEWEAMEVYLSRHFPCEFTHTLCPAHRDVEGRRV